MQRLQSSLAQNHAHSRSGIELSRRFAVPISAVLFKRIFDVGFSLLLLGLTLPTLFIAAFCIRLTSRGPVLFRQSRVGLGGREFTMFKFRTMTVSSEEVHRRYAEEWIRAGEDARQDHGAFKIAADPRITFVGRLLRKFSLDELPQLWNVLVGDMSLVGPRPALPYEVALYEAWHRQRLNALPGLTGLWQVSGRNQLTFDQMVEFDLKYIRTWSLLGDLKILLRTIPVVVAGTGH